MLYLRKPYSHLDGRKKCCNSGLSCVVPRHILLKEGLEYSVSGTPSLHFAEGEKEQEIEAIGDPVDSCKARDDDAVFGDAAHHLTATDLACAILCVFAEYEPVDNGKDWHRESCNGRAQQRAEQDRNVFSGGEAEQSLPASFQDIFRFLIDLWEALLGIACAVSRWTGGHRK